jgi:four helix bundle protein
MGSASELECCLLLARDLKLLTSPDHHQLEDSVTEVKRMLTSLHQKLTARKLKAADA